MAKPAKPEAPKPGTLAYEAEKRRELGVSLPEKKQARQFVGAMQVLMGLAQAPDASFGDRIEETISEWIVRLTDMTAEEVDEMDPHTHQLYGGLFLDMGLRLSAKPSKKR